MILLVDNYDSFTYNLAQYLGTFTEVEVLRNDDERLYERAEVADALVFSPGPGWPADAGKMEHLHQFLRILTMKYLLCVTIRSSLTKCQKNLR